MGSLYPVRPGTHPGLERFGLFLAQVVRLEESARQPVDGAECLREPSAVEAGVVAGCQVKQLIFGVPSAGQDRVHIDVIPDLCPAE